MELTDQQSRALKFIKRGRVRDAYHMAEAIGSDRKRVISLLHRMRKKGLIDFQNRHARALDWESLRVLGDGEAPAATRRAAKPRTKKTTPTKRTPRRRVSRSQAAEHAALKPSSPLMQATAVLFNAEEIEQLGELAKSLRTAADSIEAIAAVARQSPAFGTFLWQHFEKAFTGARPAASPAIQYFEQGAPRSSPATSSKPRRARKLPEILEPPRGEPATNGHAVGADEEE